MIILQHNTAYVKYSSVTLRYNYIVILGTKAI